MAMSATILDGRAAREALIPGLIERIKSLSFVPTLAIIQVGDRPDSTSFIGAKKSFAKKIGVTVKHIQVPESVSQQKLIGIVRECNADKDIHGIIVQLPLPVSLDRRAVIEAIDPRKDADALTSYRVERWSKGGEDALLPATARGIREILAHYRIALSGKRVCVVGRSDLVGTPIAAMCRDAGAAVTVCHSKTLDLPAETKKADILIVAAGKPGLIGKEHVHQGQIVIDVGINTVHGEKLEDEVEGKKLVGDADFEAVKGIVSAITPVPGGVGPMTVLALFENLVDLCKN